MLDHFGVIVDHFKYFFALCSMADLQVRGNTQFAPKCITSKHQPCGYPIHIWPNKNTQFHTKWNRNRTDILSACSWLDVRQWFWATPITGWKNTLASFDRAGHSLAGILYFCKLLSGYCCHNSVRIVPAVLLTCSYRWNVQTRDIDNPWSFPNGSANSPRRQQKTTWLNHL